MKANIIDENIMSYFYEQNGWLYWNVCRKGIQKHSLAGCLDKSGYYRVGINGKLYLNHRILYQIYNNVILTENDRIDHINIIRTDNRKENLRLDPNSQNQQNKKTYKNNLSTGLKNITIKKSKCRNYYNIRIMKNGKTVFSKFYRTDKFSEEDVIKIRDEQLKIHHGEFMSKG